MALQHAVPGEVIDAAPLGSQLGEARTTALIKTSELEVIRVVLARGRSLPTHKVPGTITIQCIEGSVEVTHASVATLQPQQVVLIDGGQPHALRALEDSSLLVTIVLHPTH